MAKNTEQTTDTATTTVAPVTKSPVFVAGFKEVTYPDGKTGIIILLKDVVSKNPVFKIKSNKTAVMPAAPGFTLESLREALPLGSPVEGASWGDEIPSEFGGIYKVEGI